MSSTSLYRWNTQAERLQPEPGNADDFGPLMVADSWRVTDGAALALDVHRARFLDAAAAQGDTGDRTAFWDAAIAAVPRTGDVFPRVDLRIRNGAATLLLHLRPAPPRTTSIVALTHQGPDPRGTPSIKGPDLAAMGVLRSAAQRRGADEVVLLAEDGSVVEGAYSAIVWWWNDALCVPDADLPRVDSVTARSVVTLATALGVDVLQERVSPAELAGREVWSLNAAQGIRILREWQGGPELAAEPGRLAQWRGRLAALRRPLPHAPSPSGS